MKKLISIIITIFLTVFLLQIYIPVQGQDIQHTVMNGAYTVQTPAQTAEHLGDEVSDAKDDAGHGSDMSPLFFIITALIVILAPAASKGADWEYFMQDNKGDSHYIDLESIKQSPSGTAKIVRKVEHGSSSEYASRVSEIEMDCMTNKIRIIKETAFSKSGKSSAVKNDGKWRNVAPEDLDELLLELVCSLKKTGT